MKISTAFRKISKLCIRVKGTAEAVIIIIQGSQGAGKTYSVLQRWLLLAVKSTTPQHVSIVSDTLPNLKTGAIKDFEEICDNEGIARTGTKTPYIMKVGMWTFEFFGVDDEKKARGSRRDRIFINEANRLTWKIAQQLISRTHIEVILDFNPVESFWAHEQYVETKVGKFIKLIYNDNEQLPKSEVDAIERHAPWGVSPDANYWRVFGLGEIGFIEGMIFKGYKPYSELPEGINYQEAIGCDFGGRDPMTATKVYVDHKNRKIYWRSIFYAANCPDVDIMSDAIKASPLYKKDDVLACDHDTVAIFSMRKKGLQAQTAIKGRLKEDIRLIRSYQLYVHEESKELKEEVNNYKYQQRKGKFIDYPDQSCEEHGIDGGRYGTTIIIRD